MSPGALTEAEGMPAAWRLEVFRRAGLDDPEGVQVRQSLPFLDFSAARWEMLVAVRNFFRDGADDQSIYDELLTISPPKRIVGGVTVHF